MEVLTKIHGKVNDAKAKGYQVRAILVGPEAWVKLKEEFAELGHLHATKDTLERKPTGYKVDGIQVAEWQGLGNEVLVAV